MQEVLASEEDNPLGMMLKYMVQNIPAPGGPCRRSFCTLTFFPSRPRKESSRTTP
jgi:hypothetical protein